MPKRTPTHRSPYCKAKPKPSAPIPLLLRRALAQLRGDPPESWPNALRAEPPLPGAPYGPELYGPQYPFPTLSLPHLLPGLSVEVTQAELRRMIDRLCRAPLNEAWRTLETRCAASRSIFPIDPGLVLLMALVESLVPINMLDQATVSKGVERIREAARELVDALEAYAAAGASLDWLMPPDPLALPPLTALLHEAIALDGTQRPRAAIRYALSRSETLLALLRSLADLL